MKHKKSHCSDNILKLITNTLKPTIHDQQNKQFPQGNQSLFPYRPRNRRPPSQHV